MAITRYAGDRFVGLGEEKNSLLTKVIDGALYLAVDQNKQFVKKDGSWIQFGGSIDGSGISGYVARWSDEDTLTSGLIFDDGVSGVGINTTSPQHALHVSGDAQISGYLYDSQNSTGEAGYILASEEGGPQWKQIEDVLSGVGGSGAANYVARWADEDTLTSGVLYDNGTNAGAGTISPLGKLDVLRSSSATPGLIARSNKDGAKMNFAYTNTNSMGEIGMSYYNATGGMELWVGGNLNSNSASHVGPTQQHTDSPSWYSLYKTHIDSDFYQIKRISTTGSYSTPFHINGDGNVGIGTTSPIGKLHIYKSDGSLNYLEANPSTEDASLGNIYGRWDGDNTSLISFRSGSDTTNKDNGDIAFYTSTAGGSLVRAMTIDENQKVGIRTTAPDASLDVRSASGSVGLTVGNTTGDTRLQISSTENSDVTFNVGDASGMGTGRDLIIKTGSSERMRILGAAGNVGIGNIAPGGKLEISESGANTELEVSTWSTTDSHNSLLRFQKSASATVNTLSATAAGEDLGEVQARGVDTNSTARTAARILFQGDAAPDAVSVPGRIVFSTSNTSGLGERMRIDDDGYVGIGTDNPKYKLDANAGLSSGGGIGYPVRVGHGSMATNGDGVGVLFSRGSSEQYFGYVRIQSTQSNPSFLNPRLEFGIQGTGTYNLADASTRMVIIGSGSVGIGTISPSYGLDVAGNARVTTDLFVNDQLAVKTTTLATSNNFHVSSGTTGSASKSSIALVSVADNSTYNSGVAALHVINSGNRGTKEHSSGSDLLRLEFSDSIHTIFNKDGNVGIGTTNPQGTLDLGNATAGKSIVWGGTIGTNHYTSIWSEYGTGSLVLAGGLKSSTTDANFIYPYTGTYGYAAIELDSFSDDGIKFYTAADAARTAGAVATKQERMRIDTSGNVGIGTTSADLKLHINNAGGSPNTRFSRGTSYIFDLKIDNIITNSAIDYIIEPNQASSGILFRTHNSSNTNINALAINRDGNVGIGTLNPLQKLHVVGSTLISNNNYHYGYTSGGAQATLVGIKSNDYVTIGQLNANNVGTDIYGGTGNIYLYSGSINRLTVSSDVNIQGATDLQINGPSRRLNFNSGTGTVRTTTSNNLILQTNSISAITIYPTQQVQFNAYGSGTFTGTAAQRLAVDSSGNIIEIPIGSGAVDGSGAANKVTYWTDTDTISYNNNFHWDNTNGNLGVGTATPSSTLHVSDSTSGSSVLKVDGTSGTIFEVTDDLSSSLMSVNTIAGLPVFEVFADNHIVAGRYNQNDFYLNTNGNLGLGTSAPSYKLDIGGSTSSTVNTLRLHQANGGTAIRVGPGGGGNDITLLRVDGTSSYNSGTTDSGNVGFSLKYMGSRDGNLNALSIFTDNVTAASQIEAVTIVQDGNVGIGTADPDQKLEVSGNQRISSNGLLEFFGGTVYPQISRNTTSGGLIIDTAGGGVSNSNPLLSIRENGGTDFVTVLGSGYVGIGTGTPSTKLEVVGETKSTNYRFSGPSDGGAVPAYSNSSYATVKYNEAQRATELVSSSDDSIGMAFPAFRVNESAGEQWKLWVQYKASASSSTGFYARVYEYSAELPADKIAVSSSASNPVVQEDTSGRTDWKVNVAISTTWVTSTYTYTPTAGAKWASIVLLNWTGMGYNSLYARVGKERFFGTSSVITGSGTVNKLPLWDGTNSLTDSIITQSSTNYVTVFGGVQVSGNHTDTGSQLNLWCDSSGHGKLAVYDMQFLTGSNSARNNTALFLKTDGNVGIGTSNPLFKLHVNGDIYQDVGYSIYSNANRGWYRGNYTTTGSGVSNGKIVTLNPAHGQTASSNYHYIFELTTIGTAANTGATYIGVYSADASAWSLRAVSLSGSTSNHPQLSVSGNNFTVYTNHSSNYTVVVSVTSVYNGDADSTAHSLGANYQWQRAVNNLYYNDGNVGIKNTVSQAYTNEGTRTVKLRVGSDTLSSNQSSAIQIGGYDSSGSGTLGAIEFFNHRDNSIVAKMQVRRDLETGTKLSAGQLDFYTDDGDNNLNLQMSIDALGKVGIGTASPTSLLHLQSASSPTLQVIDTTNNVTAKIYSQNLNAHVGTTSNHDFSIDSNNTSRIYVEAAGNVGIGTVSPDSGLTIAKAQTSAHTYTTNHLHLATPTTSNNGGATTVSFATSTVDNYGWSLSAIRETTSGGDTRFAFKSHDNSDSGNERFSILADGKVGIGTNNPKSILEIAANNPVINFKDTSAGTDLSYRYIQNVDGKMLFAKANDAYNSFTTHMAIATDGNVGIGTASPTLGKLQVAGKGYFGPVGTGDATTKALMDTYSVLKLKPHDSNSTNMTFAQVNSGAGIGIQVTNSTQTADWDIALNPYGGNVGVGTDNPQRLVTLYKASSPVIQLVNSTTGTGAGDGFLLTQTGLNTVIENSEAGYMAFRTTADEKMRIDASGNVGIGTTDPGNHKLKVAGETHSTHFITGSDWTAKTGGLHIGNDGLTTGAVSFYNGSSSSANIYRDSNILYVGARAGVNTQGLAIIADGNVGIGTAIPVTELHTYVGTTGARDAPIDVLTLETEHTSSVEYTGFGQGIVFRGSTYNQNSQRTLGRILHQINDDSGNTTRGTSMSFQTSDNGSNANAPTTKVTIDYKGDVGIGTAGPSATLHVVDTVTDDSSAEITRIQGASSLGSTNTHLRFTAASSGGSVANRWFGLQVYDHNPTARALALQHLGGNVGIGTNAPLTKLEIIGGQYSSNYPTMLNIVDDETAFSTNNNGGGISFGANYASGTIVRFIAGIQGVKENNTSGNFGGALRFSVRENGTSLLSEKMRIDSSGNVGIGTTNPGAKLHVSAGAIIGDASQTSTTLTIRATNTAGSPAATAKILMEGYEGRGIGTFYTDSTYSGEEWFCGMNYSGNFNSWNIGYDEVGGQAEYLANTKLQLHSTGKLQLHVYGAGTVTGTATKRLAVDASGNVIEIAGGIIDGSGAEDYVAKWIDTDTLGIGIIRDNGNVGIGVAPANGYKLKVDGNGYFSGTLTEASSLAIKENIENFTPSIDKINKIRPVKYNKKGSDKKEIGLIAEELEELFPELVEKDENGNPSGVNYSRAVTVLLGGFKELYKELQEIKKRI